MSIEDYDFRTEQLRLTSFHRSLEMAERQHVAKQAAISEHPVVAYVKSLPVEDSVYPAIEYLRLAEQVGCTVWEAYHAVQEGRTEFTDLSGNTVTFRHRDHTFLHWGMPGHDQERPERCGCGFIRSRQGGIVYSMCPDHPEHHCKGKRRHCWSLRCPHCMNDTALKHGVKSERNLLRFKKLCDQQGIRTGDLGHWVMSPPQEFAKCMMQTTEDYNELMRFVCDSFQDIGATAGITVFHPWRQKEMWKLAPHFHIICYGRLDTRRFLREHPGWIIKKVHSRERLRSVRHTLAYLFTHMGLGISEVDPDEVDWDMEIMNTLIPGIKTEGAGYRDSDYEDELRGKGRMVGDLTDIDWDEWTMDRLSRDVRIREWGGIARNRIRLVGFERRYKIRVCRECGEILRVYDGDRDDIGSHVRYIQDVQVVCFAHHFDIVYGAFLRYKADLKSEGKTIVHFAACTPFTVSDDMLDIPKNDDLVMPGPFAEPDEFFLRRQRKAFGE